MIAVRLFSVYWGGSERVACLTTSQSCPIFSMEGNLSDNEVMTASQSKMKIENTAASSWFRPIVSLRMLLILID